MACPAGESQTATPKAWDSNQGTYIFVPSYHGTQRELQIYSGDGELLYRQPIFCPVTVQGGGGDSYWKAILAILTLGASAAIPQLSPTQFTVQGLDSANGISIHRWRFWMMREGRVRSLLPLSVPAHSRPLNGYQARRSSILFGSTSVIRPQRITHRQRSLNGTTVVGDSDGHVRAFAAQTGSRWWDFNAGEEVLATPGSGPARTCM